MAYLLNWMEMPSLPQAQALPYSYIVIKMLSKYFKNNFPLEFTEQQKEFQATAR